MNLCGEFVTHKVFGRGKISEQESDSLTVLFSKKYGKKKFIYPSSLGTFLIPENALIVMQLKEQSDEIARQKAAAQKEADDRLAEEKRAAQNPARKAKRTSSKAPSKKAKLKTDN